MNLGADDYLTKPVAKADLLAAIRSRLERAGQQTIPEFKPNFESAKPLEIAFGLTPRVAEALLWLTQGKTNGEIATILGNSESTVKKHVLEIFEKLGVETRTAASLRALEVLSSQRLEDSFSLQDFHDEEPTWRFPYRRVALFFFDPAGPDRASRSPKTG